MQRIQRVLPIITATTGYVLIAILHLGRSPTPGRRCHDRTLPTSDGISPSPITVIALSADWRSTRILDILNAKPCISPMRTRASRKYPTHCRFRMGSRIRMGSCIRIRFDRRQWRGLVFPHPTFGRWRGQALFRRLSFDAG